MLAAAEIERFGRALIPVIAVVFLAGLVSAGAYTDPAADGTGPGRAAAGDGDSSSADPGGVPGDPGGAPLDPDAPPADPGPPEPLGSATVPAPGVYRYDVDTIRDGEPSTRVEEREISIVGEEEGASIVQVVARSDGERQVSVLEWSSAGVLVRSTRLETDEGASQDCAWKPAFTEFGALSADAEWTLDSTCATDVAGLPSVFVVTGSGRVDREAEVVHAGASVRVWQIERDRTTTITATVGTDSVEQVVREVGTFFVDPARGLVLRSDVTVTLSGTQQGVTRRTSVLAEG